MTLPTNDRGNKSSNLGISITTTTPPASEKEQDGADNHNHNNKNITTTTTVVEKDGAQVGIGNGLVVVNGNGNEKGAPLGLEPRDRENDASLNLNDVPSSTVGVGKEDSSKGESSPQNLVDVGRDEKPPPQKDNSEDGIMRFDSLFPVIGDFGRYQKRVYLLLCLPAICCAMHKLAWVFLGAKIDHRCRLPIETPDTEPYFDQLPGLPGKYPWNMTFPFEDGKLSQCKRLVVEHDDIEYYESGVPTNNKTGCAEQYVFDYSKYKSSARIDYNLMCERQHLYTQAQTLFMVGILIGSILFGDLSDRFGRRPIFFLSLVLQVVFGILAGVAPEYWTFVIARMVVGSSTSGIFLVGFVIAMEMVGPSKRTFVGVVCQLFFTAGYLVTAVMAYLISDWKILQIALSVPGLVFLSYYWFLPESVRWLLARGRKEEAKSIIRDVAKENKVDVPEEMLEALSEDDSQNSKGSASVLDLFRYRKLAFRSLNIFLCWFVNSGVYYGLSLNTSNLGGNDYINFAIAGAVEVPAYLFLLFSLNRFGRKVVLCGCMLAGGVFMSACAIIPEDLNWLLITFAMIGKMCITASYGVIYIFSAENFPTVVRNSGVGASSMCARVGGIVANNLLLLGDLWKPLPLLLFGAASLFSGLLSLLIPETFNKRLPDTMEDGERFGTKEYDAQNIEVSLVNGSKDCNHERNKTNVNS